MELQNLTIWKTQLNFATSKHFCNREDQVSRIITVAAKGTQLVVMFREELLFPHRSSLLWIACFPFMNENSFFFFFRLVIFNKY